MLKNENERTELLFVIALAGYQCLKFSGVSTSPTYCLMGFFDAPQRFHLARYRGLTYGFTVIDLHDSLSSRKTLENGVTDNASKLGSGTRVHYDPVPDMYSMYFKRIQVLEGKLVFQEDPGR